MSVDGIKTEDKGPLIYFSGSIRGGRDDQELYWRIIGLLSAYGNVLTEHIGQPSLSLGGEGDKDDEFIFWRDKLWVRQCGVLVAEVTTPSMGVGMELAYADEWKKPTLCLNRPQPGRKLSAMVGGCPAFSVREYNSIEEIPLLLSEFFAALPIRKI